MDHPLRDAGINMLATAAQCRAARALLQWTQGRLAHAADVARKTIADFEAERRPLKRRTRADITAALRLAGVEFSRDARHQAVRLRGSGTSSQAPEMRATPTD